MKGIEFSKDSIAGAFAQFIIDTTFQDLPAELFPGEGLKGGQEYIDTFGTS